MAIKAQLSSLRRRRGFTAIEVSAVATIIAILALILIPIMRGRVDEAKRVAATEDMSGIEKAETLAFADTGHTGLTSAAAAMQAGFRGRG